MSDDVVKAVETGRRLARLHQARVVAGGVALLVCVAMLLNPWEAESEKPSAWMGSVVMVWLVFNLAVEYCRARVMEAYIRRLHGDR